MIEWSVDYRKNCDIVTGEQKVVRQFTMQFFTVKHMYIITTVSNERRAPAKNCAHDGAR